MKKQDNQIVIGITAFNHDSSACIIKNNKVLAFAEEERFTKQKHTNAFPKYALQYCLSEAKISKDEIIDVAFYFNPKKCWQSFLFHNNPIAWLFDPSLFIRKRFYYELIWLMGFQNKVNSIDKIIDNKNIKIHYIDHHLAHVWYGYYASNFDDCIVMSNDSVGENASTKAMRFKKNNNAITTTELLEQKDPHSLGYLYGAVTDYLGFKRGEGEGRIMALASFGKAIYHKYFLDNIIMLPDGKFKIKKSLIRQRSFRPLGTRLSDSFYAKFGTKRKADSNINQKHYDIASGIQNALEVVGNHQLDFLCKQSDKIVLTGGVAQNSVFNGIAKNKYQNTKFKITPIPHDAGCSLGAATYVYYQKYGIMPEYTDTAFLGPAYEDKYITDMLKRYRIQYSMPKNILDFISCELNKNKVFAFFRGRMECGPRALCNRSIIASPIDKTMKDHLNNNIKYRETFRPYGGFTREKYINTILDNKNRSKSNLYMDSVYPIKEDWKSKIPSLRHIDNTCRIQTTRSEDLFINNLLDEFYKQTGVPVLINTSLNKRGFPIDRSPEDALATFYTSAIDYIVFNEKILIVKERCE